MKISLKSTPISFINFAQHSKSKLNDAVAVVASVGLLNPSPGFCGARFGWGNDDGSVSESYAACFSTWLIRWIRKSLCS